MAAGMTLAFVAGNDEATNPSRRNKALIGTAGHAWPATGRPLALLG
jgi:hypothetical protein